MLSLLATATQAAAQHAPSEFWTESSAATGTPILAYLSHAETAEPVADNTTDIPDAEDDAPTLPVGQFLLTSQDFAVTHNSEPVGAFRRKRKLQTSDLFNL